MIEIGTSWLGVRPADRPSPAGGRRATTSTRFASWQRLHEGDQGAQRVLDRLPVRGPYLRRVAPARRRGDWPCAGMPSKTEPSPTSLQSTMRGSGVHGVWLETRSISAITGRVVGLGQLEAVEARTSVYWSGIGGVAERRAGVADVPGVVDLVVVVERRALRPVLGVRRDVGDGPPAGALEAALSVSGRSRRAGRSAAGCRPTARTAAWSGPAS